MKKLSIIFFLTGSLAFAAQAQDGKARQDNYPYWTISKDVQRIPYGNVTFVPAKITTGTGGWVISKGVQRKPEEAQGVVTKSGYPSWIISKGAARKQFENSNK
ncbi:MAG TPA: hypothetical protein VGK59_22620 [Ohtaekwangia sp.]